VIGGGEFAAVLLVSWSGHERQIRPAQADAVNLSIKPSLQRFAAWYSANLMLDEPPLIVRMCRQRVSWMTPSSFCNPNEASFAQRGPVIRVKNASNPQTFRDLDEHRGVFDIDTCRAGVWAMSSASRKMSASGLRRWTKQEEIKESTNPSSLNLRIRYAFTSRASLLTTAIFSPYRP
jgi:hypothetical protein